jgi:hypothetical protein
MSEQQLFTGMTYVLFGVSAVFFVVLLFTPAPYMAVMCVAAGARRSQRGSAGS